MVLNNNKGQIIFYRIMMAILILIAVVAISTPTKQIITDTSNSTNLNCSSSTLNTAQTATCVVLDQFIFYFLGSCAAVGMAFLAGKKSITGILSSIMVFVLTVVLISPLKEWIVYIRDSNHLYCTNTAISLGNKMACIFFDAWLFWFICTAIAAGLAYLFAKEVLQ